MEDGIFATDLPYMFRVHSTSGDVEWRLVDMASGLCSCPNDGDVCSHRYAVVLAQRHLAPRLAVLIQARYDPILSLRFTGPPVPITARVLLTPQSPCYSIDSRQQTHSEITSAVRPSLMCVCTRARLLDVYIYVTQDATLYAVELDLTSLLCGTHCRDLVRQRTCPLAMLDTLANGLVRLCGAARICPALLSYLRLSEHETPTWRPAGRGARAPELTPVIGVNLSSVSSVSSSLRLFTLTPMRWGSAVAPQGSEFSRGGGDGGSS
eukprot:1176820-Prorocentrum_minimum.AAC.14